MTKIVIADNFQLPEIFLNILSMKIFVLCQKYLSHRFCSVEILLKKVYTIGMLTYRNRHIQSLLCMDFASYRTLQRITLYLVGLRVQHFFCLLLSVFHNIAEGFHLGSSQFLWIDEVQVRSFLCFQGNETPYCGPLLWF